MTIMEREMQSTGWTERVSTERSSLWNQQVSVIKKWCLIFKIKREEVEGDLHPMTSAGHAEIMVTGKNNSLIRC